MSIKNTVGGAMLAGGITLLASSGFITYNLDKGARELKGTYEGFRLENELGREITIRDAMTLNAGTSVRYRALNAEYDAIKDTPNFRAAKAQYGLYENGINVCNDLALLSFPVCFSGMVILCFPEKRRVVHAQTAKSTT